MIEINILSVIAATVATMAIGFAWYSDSFFGRQWKALSGITPEKMAASKDGMWFSIIGGIVSAFLMSYVIAHFVVLLQIDTLSDVLNFTFWSWLGFVATTQSGALFWERRPMALYMINAGYYLPVILVIVSFTALWPW